MLLFSFTKEFQTSHLDRSVIQMTRWLWGNSMPPFCSKTTSKSSWSARRNTMATVLLKRAPRVQRFRLLEEMLLPFFLFLFLWTWYGYCFQFLSGGFKEHRGRSSSRDAQGNFRRLAEWGRNGQSHGRSCRRNHLSSRRPISKQKPVIGNM